MKGSVKGLKVYATYVYFSNFKVISWCVLILVDHC